MKKRLLVGAIVLVLLILALLPLAALEYLERTPTTVLYGCNLNLLRQSWGYEFNQPGFADCFTPDYPQWNPPEKIPLAFDEVVPVANSMLPRELGKDRAYDSWSPSQIELTREINGQWFYICHFDTEFSGYVRPFGDTAYGINLRLPVLFNFRRINTQDIPYQELPFYYLQLPRNMGTGEREAIAFMPDGNLSFNAQSFAGKPEWNGRGRLSLDMDALVGRALAGREEDGLCNISVTRFSRSRNWLVVFYFDRGERRVFYLDGSEASSGEDSSPPLQQTTD